MPERKAEEQERAVGEVDIDGADTVAKTPLQCRAHQWSRFQVDFTGQGEQRPFPSVMAVDGELWEGHDASVQKTIRSARGDAGISGPLGALQAGTYVRLGWSNGRSDSLCDRTEDPPSSLQGCAG